MCDLSRRVSPQRGGKYLCSYQGASASPRLGSHLGQKSDETVRDPSGDKSVANPYVSQGKKWGRTTAGVVCPRGA